MMDLVLKNGAGFISRPRVVDKDYTDCTIFGVQVPITASKDARKKIENKYIVRNGVFMRNINEDPFREKDIPNGKHYRAVKKVTAKTNMGELFGETIYSPDTTEELLLIATFFVTDTDEEVPKEEIMKENIDEKTGKKTKELIGHKEIGHIQKSWLTDLIEWKGTFEEISKGKV